jgi:hypothetical protein
VRRIGTTPYYLGPPWMKNRYEQINQYLCTIPNESSSIRFCAETAKILEEKHNEHMKKQGRDDTKKYDKVGCAVITPDQKFRKRLKFQNMVYSAEQKAIIKAIYVTQRTGRRQGNLAHSWQ